jgi:hypothetical protein
MSTSLKHFILQGAILVSWAFLLILPLTNASVEAQITCPKLKYLAPIPGWSWYKDTEVTVKIDSNWTPSERSAIANGNAKWNDFNCSGVEFVSFSEKTYTQAEYDSHPPNGFVYWQRIDPVNQGFSGGVFYKFDTQDRTTGARIKIHPNLQNLESGTHFIWLGAHEIGHTFNLDDCLCANQCSCQGQVSVMSGHGSASFNTDVPKIPCDYDAIDAIYCPIPTPSPTPTPEPLPTPCEDHCSGIVAVNQACFGPADLCTFPDNDGCQTGLSNVAGCCCIVETPVLIDVLGDGFNLTNPTNGVNFDIDMNGTREKLSWTATNSDDAWLVLDRNGNGLIDNGGELFGNHTTQPEPIDGNVRNGFLALAVFDKSAHGGTEDGFITSADVVFNSLRLWQDTNHNGISESIELKTFSALGLTKIELEYKKSRRTDSNGNVFLFRAKVKDEKDAHVGRWAWDVVLAKGQ